MRDGSGHDLAILSAGPRGLHEVGMEQEQQRGVAPSAGPPRGSLFGVRFDLLTTAELRGWVRGVLDGPPESRHVAFSNSEFVLEARRNPQLRRYLNGCDLNLADGIGVVYAFRFLTSRRPERLSGTVFVATMCEEAAASGARVFLFGSRPGVAERAAEGLGRRAPGLVVCGTADGFGDASTVLEQIRATAPDVLVVCLGNPLQERWVEEHISELRLKLVWGAGGALDFYSGDVPLAPDWVQRAGLEWLFRLVTNFSIARLRRQLRLVEFVVLVLRERVRHRRLRRRAR
jgi:N-acetylglucosaminyldiphosphoundecaprenol N-acetyl-beta-D-mannosaminyltransferase